MRWCVIKGGICMNDFEEIFKRVNIQEIRSLFLEGLDLQGYDLRPDPRSYEERLHEAERPLMKFVEELYPDGKERDQVVCLINDAILINQKVYTEIGMRLGAQIILELLGESGGEK